MSGLLSAVRDNLAGLDCEVYLRPRDYDHAVIAVRGDWGACFPVSNARLDDVALGQVIGKDIVAMLTGRLAGV